MRAVADLKKNEISQLPNKPVAKKYDYEAKKIFDKPDAAKLKDEKTLNDAGNYPQNNPFGLSRGCGLRPFPGGDTGGSDPSSTTGMITPLLKVAWSFLKL